MLRFASAALAVGLLAGSAAPSGAVILNSLRGFDRVETGWSGAVDGSFAAAGGNSEESTFAGSGRLQWRNARHTVKLIGGAARTTRGGVETAESVIGHLRHNYRLGAGWSSLAFLQTQRNPFQRLESRNLAGLGARYDLIDRDRALWSLGAAHMFESERIKDRAGHTEVQRLSAFTSVEAGLREGVTLDFLTFFQPRWNDFGDWRLFGQVRLEVAVTGTLALYTAYQVEHDSRPPAGVERTDWSTKTGFRASF